MVRDTMLEHLFVFLWQQLAIGKDASSQNFSKGNWEKSKQQYSYDR